MCAAPTSRTAAAPRHQRGAAPRGRVDPSRSCATPTTDTVNNTARDGHDNNQGAKRARDVPRSRTSLRHRRNNMYTVRVPIKPGCPAMPFASRGGQCCLRSRRRHVHHRVLCRPPRRPRPLRCVSSVQRMAGSSDQPRPHRTGSLRMTLRHNTVDQHTVTTTDKTTSDQRKHRNRGGRRA